MSFLAGFNRFQAQGDASGEKMLAPLGQGMELPGVQVAQQPLQPELAVETPAAANLQGGLAHR
jgi:hypothetical protein